MYHEATYDDLRRRRVRRIGAVVAVVLACTMVWAALTYSSDVAREQGAKALRESVVTAAMQCCAVEGSYPTSVKHLEEHYGLVINHDDYRVSYEWLGDNIAPSVVVRPL